VRLSDQMTKSPFLLLGGAFGAGYLIGGGLASPLTGRLLRLSGALAWRLMILPALQQKLRATLAAQAPVGEPDGH
jgi:hypothetical protein